MGRRALVVANWKMNGQKARIASLSKALLSGLAGISRTEVVICPPCLYLAQVQAAFQESTIGLGGQNLYTEDSGAYTGEISAPMLKDFDCRYVILGHSERRKLFAETDALVAAKVVAAQVHGLTPIICVGESAAQRQAGTTEAVVRRQVEAIFQHAGAASFENAVIAYEPLWAIGSGRAATPEKAQSVHELIRGIVAGKDERLAAGLRILYGGSVNASNAAEFYGQPDIDGALVGGASLIAEEFAAICSGVERAQA
jgi:triosephosphate isomerase (TIM)